MAYFDDIDFDLVSRASTRPKPVEKPKERGFLGALNDTVIEFANAAAGGIGAAADFVVPGNALSNGIDEFIKSGEEKQSDVVKAGKADFRQRLDQSGGVADDLSAVGSYIVNNPVQTMAQAAGSFVGPGVAIKGANMAARRLGASAGGAQTAGRVAGIGAGAAMGGGDAGGNAYDLVMATPDEVLLQNPEVDAMVRAGTPLAVVKQTVATSAARQASVLPALAGGAAGAFGAEKILAAGGVAKTGMRSIASTAGVEGLTEGIEEGLAQYEGQRAAQAYNPSIDPTKNVAAMAGMGAVMGAGTGGAVAALSGQQPGVTPAAPAAPAGPLARAAGAVAPGTTESIAAAAGPMPVDDPVAETIQSLPDGVRETAMRAYAAINNPDVAKGVRIYNQKLLDGLLEQVAGDAQAGLEKVQKDGAAIDSSAPAATEKIAPKTTSVDPSTGEIVTAFDQREADRPKQQPDDILNAQNKPFTNMGAAKKTAQALGDGFAPFKLGTNAFVVRAKPADQAPDVAGKPIDKDWTAFTPESGAKGVAPGVQAGAAPAVAAGDVRSAPAQAGPVYMGRNNQPLTDGGKPFKTRLAAAEAKKLQPMMRVVSVKDGFSLIEKTEKQLAAEAKAARRLRNPQTSAPGEPIPAHAFIAAEGGLHADTRPDMNIGANPKIGNRSLFAGKGRGLSMERATARLIEEGYLSEGASHSEAMALIKRSLTQPQYNADGYERIAEADNNARYAAYELEVAEAVAQVESLDDNEFDILDDSDIPWGDAPSTASTEAVMRALGFTEQEIQDEAITQESGITSANSKGGNRPGEAATSGAPGGDGRGAPAPQLDLTSPSPAEVVAQQGRAETAAKAETLDFDNGEPVRVPAGATDQQIAAATSERAPEAGNRAADVGAAGGQSGLFANEPAADYTDAYEADLFGEPLPKPQRKAGAAQPAQPRLRGNVQPADTPAPERAEFYVNTLIGSEVSRELGAARIVTPEQAAQATRHLYKSAVERFDGIVTDKSGKPIAVIGGFKGAVGQASVYPGTLMAEAIRIPGAANVWFSHNHPGGKAVLSRADVALNATLSDVFRGSGIEPMGLLAVSGNEFSHVSALGEGEYNPVKTFQPSIIKKMVPVMERQLEESPPQAPISSPTDAKAVAKIFYDKNKEPGILLLSSQHAPVGWLPISEVMMGPLRGSGGAASIYRAVSQSNAASAIIVHGGELDATVARSGVTVSQNIAAALKKVDVLPLDSINAVDGQSAAESGFDLARGPMFSRSTPEEKNALKALSENDDLFALPKSDSKTVEGITADAKAGITVKKEKDTVGRTVYTFTMDDGKTATMSVRPFNPYATEEAPTLYGYTLKDGEMTGLAIERPGNNPEEAGNLDDVWVDVSRLKAGSGGLAIYNIAQTYAHNTGRIFIGDPAGLTDAALRRRTEQMLSSALKFGTTKHLAPHPRQVEGDKALGIPPLQWTYGDDLGNIESLIQTSLASYNHVNPLAFEPSTGRFLDSEGHELDADAIRQIAEVGPGRAAGAGRTTLQRAAIFESLVREGGGESGGARAGAGVLERLVELARQFGASTHKVFYSRGDTSASGASSVEARASTAEVERIVQGITSRWANAPEVVVVYDMTDSRIPAKVRAQDLEQRSGGATGDPEGFFLGGKVYILASQVGTPKDVARVLFHESLGHFGLRGHFGGALKPVLQQIAALRRPEVAAKATQYGLDMANESQRLQAAEEVLVEMAQTRPEIGFVKRAIAIIRTWLRRNVPGFKNIALTDAEIINDYLLPARGFVERGMADRSGAARGMAPAFWRGTNEAMKNKDVVGKTQGGRSADDISPGVLTDEKGKPITLYHGGLVWDKFESEKSGRDALWLTPSVADASGYADQYSKKDGREIKAFHVTMNKPLDLTNTKVVDQVFGEDNAPTAAEMARDRQLIEQALKYAKKNGYDGMIHPDSDNLNRYSNGRISYAVFSKDQLQLAPLTGNEQDSNTYGIPLRSKLNEPTTPESGGVTMKEIEALNDTPTVAIMKEAVDAIGETEFQRRVKKKTEKVTANGKFQASESMLVEATAREVVAISRRNGDFDGGKADIRFSRTAISTAANRVADKLNETFSHPGKLNWWHKSFGTMNNLAERSPAFKPVFNAAQNFINDVSYYATEAADLAPKMLPKLDKWSDLFKSPITAADNKAISAPIFEGTLSWARDEQGKPVRMDDLEATYAKLSDEEKAQMLLKKRFVTEGELKRWKASPLDIYEGAVRNRFKTNFLTPGVVWKDAELVSLFKLTPEQISLYREFLAATDKSLDNLAKADMLRFGGKDVAHLQDMVMDAKDADEAAVMLRDYLHSLRDLMPEKVDELNNTASGMIERADKVNKLKAQGYAPLSRFGKYTVDVVVDGERQFFSLFETVRDANKMAAKMKMEYGAANVAQGTLSESEFKLFAGITPESLELFGNMLGLDSTGDAARDKAFQTYLKLTKTNRSAMRRMIHRKGIAGFSEDAGRVLAAFVYSNARQTSAALHMSGMGDAINDIPKSQGELKDAAIALADYIKSPQEEAQAIRGLLFAQYLGGSVASAFVNMMQPFAVTFPWLSQYGGAKQSGEQLLRAMKDMATKGFVYEPELAKALHKAEELGIVSPQEVHQLMAQARGASSLKPGDGTRTGDAMAKASNALSRLSFGWGQVFGMAEQLNRRSTFIAAYRVAKAQGMKNPADFAKKAVNDTQFIYNRGNKMRFGRGAVGATLMTFKTFSIAYMELLSRMYSQGGPEGKKAVLLALGVMLLMGGAGGLPFAEDAEDLVDGMLQRLGYNVSIKKAKQEFLENLFGKAGADFVERGVSGLPGMPLDVSGRLGMGNLVPGTGLFKSKSSHARDLGELAGPAGDFGRRLFEAGGQVLGGDVVKAALTASPVAVRNAAKGLDMAGTGMYRDDKGYKVLDTSLLEAAFKSIGFQPATVAKVQEANFINQQAKNFYSQTAADIRARWAKGIFEKDPGQIESARDMIRIWNEKNPDQPIRPNMPAILKRVREMSKSKDQRIADTAPKAMRVQMRLDMAERRAAQE